MEGSCECIKKIVADRRKGMVLQIGGWVVNSSSLWENLLVTIRYAQPW